VCIDWGTSRLRAYLVGEDGSVHDRRATAQGVMAVAPGAFAAVLEATVGDWRRASPGGIVLMSGMVGSRQGWREAPYAESPAGAAELAGRLVEVDAGGDGRVLIVPGVARRHPDGVPDVMRGEECQILGAAAADDGAPLLYVLPGTHSKWALCQGGRIIWFATFMTGELFAVLCEHSILGRLMAPGDDDAAAFHEGLERGAAEPPLLLRRLFSARTLGLFDEIPAAALRGYLSGLLIGSEIREAELSLGGAPAPRLTVIGASTLAARYRDALERRGYRVAEQPEEVAVAGMLRVAAAAGLW
jgi:2-dehydro-3-deoxygalactonokinase